MKLCNTWIIVRARFQALHRYPAAPEAVRFLRETHRHEFHVSARIQVFHDDRELEFFLVQKTINLFLERLPFDLGAKSCEMIAHELIDHLRLAYGQRCYAVKVSEDGENAALVEAWT